MRDLQAIITKCLSNDLIHYNDIVMYFNATLLKNSLWSPDSPLREPPPFSTWQHHGSSSTTDRFVCVGAYTAHVCVNLISLVRENEQHKGGDKEGGEIWQCLPLFCVAAEHKNIRDVKAELVNISESHLGHFNTTRNVCVLCLNVCKNRVSLPSDSTDGAEQECMKTRSICQSEWKMWPSAPSVLGQRRQ